MQQIAIQYIYGYHTSMAPVNYVAYFFLVHHHSWKASIICFKLVGVKRVLIKEFLIFKLPYFFTLFTATKHDLYLIKMDR